MAKKNRASKADVQSTELNRMPNPGQEDTEFAAEQEGQRQQRRNQRQQQQQRQQ